MLVAKNRLDLAEKLYKIDVHVDSRSQGRTTDQVERYAVVLLFQHLIKADILSFPLELQKSERPDFILRTSESNIGIEHTEAVSEKVAYSDSLREQGYGPEVHHPIQTLSLIHI